MPVRKIPKSYRAITGRFPSIINGRCINYESGLERDFYLSLEFDRSIIRYEEQPIKIEGTFDGKNISYHPDCLIEFRDEIPSRLVEIKYAEELEIKAAEYRPRFELASAYVEEHGMEFLIFTEEDIRDTRLDNYRLLYRFARPPNKYLQYKDKILEFVAEMGTATLRELLSKISSDRIVQAGFTPVIWHLLFTGDIQTDLDIPLGHKTSLRLSYGNKNIP